MTIETTIKEAKERSLHSSAIRTMSWRGRMAWKGGRKAFLNAGFVRIEKRRHTSRKPNWISTIRWTRKFKCLILRTINWKLKPSTRATDRMELLRIMRETTSACACGNPSWLREEKVEHFPLFLRLIWISLPSSLFLFHSLDVKLINEKSRNQKNSFQFLLSFLFVWFWFSDSRERFQGVFVMEVPGIHSYTLLSQQYRAVKAFSRKNGGWLQSGPFSFEGLKLIEGRHYT